MMDARLLSMSQEDMIALFALAGCQDCDHLRHVLENATAGEKADLVEEFTRHIVNDHFLSPNPLRWPINPAVGPGKAGLN